MKKKAVNLKESKEGSMEGFGGRKGKWEMMQLHYNLKKIKVEKETKTPWFEHKALIKIEQVPV